jgi:hypothetical protein
MSRNQSTTTWLNALNTGYAADSIPVGVYDITTATPESIQILKGDGPIQPGGIGYIPQINFIGSAGSGGGGVQSVVAGTNIAVNSADPQNPVVSVTGINTGVQSISSGSANVHIAGTAAIPSISVDAGGVQSITPGTSNVHIGGTAAIPIISVDADGGGIDGITATAPLVDYQW